MALTTTQQVLQALELYSVVPGSSDFARYDALRRGMEMAVKSFCKWPIEQDTITDYYDGNGYQDIILRAPYVSSVQNVWLNMQGFYGQDTNSGFTSAFLLTAGSDYALVQEQPNVSKCGLLRRLAVLSFWFPSSWIFLQGVGGLSYRPSPYWQVGQGNIAVQYTYGWPGAVGVVSITQAAGVATVTTVAAHGLTTGMRVSLYNTQSTYDGTNYRVIAVPTPTTFTIPFLANAGTAIAGTANGVPDDLQAAVCEAVGIFRNQVKYGGVTTSESLGDYNYSITLNREPMFGDIRELLGQYRDSSFIGI